MSAFKGTPGPWINGPQGVRHDGGFIAFPCAPREVAGEREAGESWLDMYHRRRPARDEVAFEQKANARLIAAAPDLLEALVALFNDYKRLADSGDAGFWNLEDVPEGKQALAAIAKALGEQP